VLGVRQLSHLRRAHQRCCGRLHVCVCDLSKSATVQDGPAIMNALRRDSTVEGCLPESLQMAHVEHCHSHDYITAAVPQDGHRVVAGRDLARRTTQTGTPCFTMHTVYSVGCQGLQCGPHCASLEIASHLPPRCGPTVTQGASVLSCRDVLYQSTRS
jgi:hypothetical protein